MSQMSSRSPPEPCAPDAVPLVVGLDLGGTKMAAAWWAPMGLCKGRWLPARPRPTTARPPCSTPSASSCRRSSRRAPAGLQPEPCRSRRSASAPPASSMSSANDPVRHRRHHRLGRNERRRRLRERLAAAGLGELPVHVENDVDAYAAGEAWLGAGAGPRSSSWLRWAPASAGPSSRGEPAEAPTTSPARSVTPVPGAQGEPCTCGRPGHLEVSPPARRSTADTWPKGETRMSPTPARWRGAQPRRPHRPGVYRDSAACLGRPGGLVTVIDPDVVVVSGSLARAGDLWWGP